MQIKIILAVAASALIVPTIVNAQDAVRETTTTIVKPTEAIGTITEFATDAIVIRTKEATTPIRYMFTKTTEYVDEAGNPIARETVKTGLPVTIRYVKDGDHMVVSRVVVRKQTTTTPDAVTTTTSTTVQPTEAIGTVTEFATDAVVVRTKEATAPVRYVFTKTTEYVDEAGNRIEREFVKTGVPVTIRYVKDGDRMVVSRVIVRKETTPAEPETVTTKKTTTVKTTKE